MPRAVIHATRAAALSFIAALPLVGQGIADDASVNEVAQGNRLFALQLYRKLSTTEGNLFFSPRSISTALAMTYGGAREATASQMATTLHFTLDQEELHAGFAALEKKLNAIGQADEVRIHVANSIWPSTRHEFLPAYLDLVREHYGTSVTPLDYIREPEKARQTINGWVEEKTEERIKDLIPTGVVGPSTAMVLANAIYFKGNWVRRFDEKATRDAPFYLSADQPVDVPMMRQEAAFRYLKRDEIELLELPYEGDDLSMLLLLPELVRIRKLPFQVVNATRPALFGVFARCLSGCLLENRWFLLGSDSPRHSDQDQHFRMFGRGTGSYVAAAIRWRARIKRFAERIDPHT
jgi:serine protease inhibitor